MEQSPQDRMTFSSLDKQVAIDLTFDLVKYGQDMWICRDPL